MIKCTIEEIIGFAPIFSSPGDSHTKGLLVLIHSGLEGVTKDDTDLIKEGLCPLRLFPLMAEFSMFIPAG